MASARLQYVGQPPLSFLTIHTGPRGRGPANHDGRVACIPSEPQSPVQLVHSDHSDQFPSTAKAHVAMAVQLADSILGPLHRPAEIMLPSRKHCGCAQGSASMSGRLLQGSVRNFHVGGLMVPERNGANRLQKEWPMFL
jgi:hypothetical protein